MKPSFILGIVLFVVALIGGIYAINRSVTAPGPYDAFAQCLTESGAKMYGAFWCPHCKDQKKRFGKSWKYVNYIECSLPSGKGQTQECEDADIEGYPTWEFADGERQGGNLTLEKLADETGCELTQ